LYDILVIFIKGITTVIGNTTDLYFEVLGILYNIILSPANHIDEIHVESG